MLFDAQPNNLIKVHIFWEGYKITFLLAYVVSVRSKVEILQNFVAFSEYMNFNQTEVQVDFASTISLFTIVT